MLCAIIDETPDVLDTLKTFIDQTPILKLDKCFTNPFDVIRNPPGKEIDLIFVGTELSYLSGFELISTLTSVPQVIIISGSKGDAVNAFDIKATDFLLKPLKYPRFLQAVQAAYEKLLLQSGPIATPPIQSPDEHIWIKSEYNYVKISLAQILYIEGLKDYLKIYLKGRDKPVLTLNTLKKIEEKLPSFMFKRVHRSYIISLTNIDCISRNQIKIGGARISIGENYREQFYQSVIGSNLI